MNRTVTRPEDRAMFDFLDAKTPDTRPAASDGFAEAAGPEKPKDELTRQPMQEATETLRLRLPLVGQQGCEFPPFLALAVQPPP